MDIEKTLEGMDRDLAEMRAADPIGSILYNMGTHMALSFNAAGEPYPGSVLQARTYSDSDRRAPFHPHLRASYRDGTGSAFMLTDAKVAFKDSADNLESVIKTLREMLAQQAAA